MVAFRYAHARAPDWESGARSCLLQLELAATSYNLGFLYVTDKLADDLPELLGFLRLRTGVENWVGTVGLGVCSVGVEYFDEPALAILIGEFPKQSFRIFSSIVSDLEQFELENDAWCTSAEPYFGVVHGDPRNVAIGGLIARLAERMGSGFLVGGLTSSRGALSQIAADVTHGGLSGVLFGRSVSVTTRLTQGCSPIGPRREITECQGNVISSLDGRPALDVLYEEIGDVLARNPANIAGYIFAGLPVRGSDTGDYLVRNLVGIDPDNKCLAIVESVSRGEQILFCRRDAQSAEDDLRRMLRDIKRSLHGSPRGGIYFSCLARGPNLFGPNSDELRLIEEELGRFPLAGFFANGEISHDRLYTYTGVLTLFA